MRSLLLTLSIFAIFFVSTINALIGAQDYVAPGANNSTRRVLRASETQENLEDILKLKDSNTEDEEDIGPLGEVQLDVAEEDLEPEPEPEAPKMRFRRGYGGGGGGGQQKGQSKYGGGQQQGGGSKYGSGNSGGGSKYGGGQQQQSSYGQSSGQSKYGGGQQQPQQQYY